MPSSPYHRTNSPPPNDPPFPEAHHNQPTNTRSRSPRRSSDRDYRRSRSRERRRHRSRRSPSRSPSRSRSRSRSRSYDRRRRGSRSRSKSRSRSRSRDRRRERDRHHPIEFRDHPPPRYPGPPHPDYHPRRSPPNQPPFFRPFDPFPQNPSHRRGGRASRRDDGPPGVSLLVRNVSHDITPQDLQMAFGRIGEVRDVYIPRDFHSHQPKGFAFIEYATADMAREARDEMDRFLIKGKELEVVYAQEKRKTPNEMRGRVVDGRVVEERNGGGGGGGGGEQFQRSSSFERHKRRERERENYFRPEHENRKEE